MLIFAHLHRTHWEVIIVTTSIMLIVVFQSVTILSCNVFLLAVNTELPENISTWLPAQKLGCLHTLSARNTTVYIVL